MSTTRTPQICSDFSGNPGDPVQWQGLPASCTISQVTSGNNTTFPFTPASGSNGSYYINLPSAGAIKIAPGLQTGVTYSFVVSCCTTADATHTVHVT
jgi:hypothetical protein